MGGRVTLNKGDGTPGTPANPALVRQPPVYQRLPSNDSGKGSDKDVNGNGGAQRDWLDGPSASVARKLPTLYKISNSNRAWGIGTRVQKNSLPPIPKTRRGSAAATRLSEQPPPIPSRSRSLDGLLDSAEGCTSFYPTINYEKLVTDKDEQIDVEKDFCDSNKTDKTSTSQSSLSTESNKRKRNFMDRCVNKVRSLIRKWNIFYVYYF